MLELFKTRLRAAICTHFHVYGGQSDYAVQHAKWFINCKGNIHCSCSQREQPSHAAIEDEGRIVVHHEPIQKKLYDSTGLRISGRRCWFIIYEQD